MNQPLRTLAGVIDNPVEFFEAEKRRVMDALSKLSDMRVTLNRTLIAVWVRPEARDLGGGKKLFMTDNTRAEDVYQGCTGLVIALGPQAFVSDANVHFEVCPKIGDWVLFRRQNAGLRFKHNDIDCVLLDNETPVMAIVSRPDYVE